MAVLGNPQENQGLGTGPNGRSVIDAIPLRNSPAFLVLETFTCNRATNCPSARRFFAAEREKLRRPTRNLLHFDGRGGALGQPIAIGTV